MFVCSLSLIIFFYMMDGRDLYQIGQILEMVGVDFKDHVLVRNLLQIREVYSVVVYLPIDDWIKPHCTAQLDLCYMRLKIQNLTPIFEL